MDFSLTDVPPMPNALAHGDPLQESVDRWASQFLQAFNASRTAKPTTTTTTRPSAPEPPTQRLKRLSLGPNNPKLCARSRKPGNNDTPAPGDAMACAFYKRDPKRHRSCGYAVSIRNARAARHHAVIHHAVPIYCATCHVRFPSAVARDEHERRRSCTREERTGEPIDGVTEDLVPKILQRDAGKGPRCTTREDEQDNWFRLWDTLFPGVKRPATAYMSSPEERELVALRRFWKRAGPTLVNGLLGEGADEERLQAVQASILEKMVEQAGL